MDIHKFVDSILYPHKHRFVRVPGKENLAKCGGCGEYSDYRRVGQEKMWTSHTHDWDIIPVVDGRIRVRCAACEKVEELVVGSQRFWIPVDKGLILSEKEEVKR